MDELEACKILYWENALKLNVTNLERLINQITKEIPRDTPVAILSIIGSPENDALFLTNLLLHYYQADKKGEWLNMLLNGKTCNETDLETMPKSVKSKVGFSMDKINDFEDNGNSASKNSVKGVYLWPKAFEVENNDNNQTKKCALIMHLCGLFDDTELSIQASFNKFLTIACSRIAEVTCHGKEFQLLNSLGYFQNLPEMSPFEVSTCESIVHILRNDNQQKIKSLTDDEAKEYLRHSGAEYDDRVLKKLKYVNVTKLKPFKGPLLNESGAIDANAIRPLTKDLKSAISTIADESEIYPKLFGKEFMSLETMLHYFEECIRCITYFEKIYQEEQKVEQMSGNSQNRECSPSHACCNQTDTVDSLGGTRTAYSNENVKDLTEKFQTISINEEIVDTPREGSNDDANIQSEVQAKEAVLVSKDNLGDHDEEDMRAAVNSADLELKEEKRINEKVKKLLNKFKLSLEAALDRCFSSRNVWNDMDEVENLEMKICRHIETTVNGESFTVEKKNKIIKNCKDFCLSYISTIKNYVSQFQNEAFSKFEENSLVNDRDIDEHINSIVLQEFTDTKILCFVKQGCERFVSHLNFIKRHEEKLAVNIMEKIILHYKNLMTGFLNAGVYTPDDLLKIHQGFIYKAAYILQTFIESKECVFHAIYKTEFSKLEHILNPYFAKYRVENQLKLKSQQEIMQKIIQSCKESYILKIEQELSNNPNGILPEELKNKHKGFLYDIYDVLKLKTRSKISHTEPIETHLSTLEYIIDSYWREVQIGNQRKLQLNAAKPTTLENGQKQECLKQMDSASNFSDKTMQSTSRLDSFFSCSKEVTPVKDLPPLIVQLISNGFKVSILSDGKIEIIKNCFGETITPLFILLTSENMIKFGSEAMSYYDYYKAGMTLCRWEFLDVAFYNNHSFPLPTLEFLFSYILRKVKYDVETKRHGVCSAIVITTPTWFDSTLRVRIKHSAEIAGFEKVLLVNELTAAAVAYRKCLSSTQVLPIDISVLSYNFNVVEATSYTLNNTDIAAFGHSSIEGSCLSKYYWWRVDLSQDDIVIKNLSEVVKQAQRKKKVHCCLIVSECDTYEKQTNIAGNSLALFSPLVSKDYVSLGAALMIDNINCYAVRDMLGYCINYSFNKVAVQAWELLPFSKSINTQASLQNDIHLYRWIGPRKVMIATIMISKSVPCKFFEIHLSVSSEAIVQVDDIYMLFSGNKHQVSKTQLGIEQYQVQYMNLPHDEVANIKNELDRLCPTPCKFATSSERQHFKHICQEFGRLISSGSIKIQNDLIRKEITQKISLIEKEFDRNEVTLVELQQQEEILKAYYEKYCPRQN